MASVSILARSRSQSGVGQVTHAGKGPRTVQFVVRSMTSEFGSDIVLPYLWMTFPSELSRTS